ncbi:MAG: protein kinase [Polyangiaceae bacterium]
MAADVDVLPRPFGEFVLEGRLGEGGSAIVYEASYRGEKVALKVARPDAFTLPGDGARFLSEAALLARVRHPNLVEIVTAGTSEDGRPYVAMRFHQGEALATAIARGRLPVPKAVHLFSELASALEAVHAQGLLHRDIKPENVLLVDGGSRVVLLDFGVAKERAAPASTLTRAGLVRGTRSSMAPERFFGEAASVATDVYELAVVLYAMLVGEMPWHDPSDVESRLFALTPEERGVTLPVPLVEVLMSALSTRQERRPKTASGFAERVRAAVAFAIVFVIAFFGAPRTAHAELDAFAIGTGKDGALVVGTTPAVVNTYAPVTSIVNAATVTVGTSVGGTAFRAGDLVLVWQVGGSTATSTATPTTLDLAAGAVGTWEFARIATVTLPTVVFTSPLEATFAAGVTQLVKVPEYTSVTVGLGRSILATPWNGSAGGIVAFLATGNVQNDGAVNVDGSGFRGGLQDSMDNVEGCAALDGPVGTGGALAGGSPKGEGIQLARYWPTLPLSGFPPGALGFGAVANGAGGGNCKNAGGGGGGHVGAGGHGGRTKPGDGGTNGRDVGGRGGAALAYDPYVRFSMGGGGGAGHGNSNVHKEEGGNGGGFVFVRAQSFAGIGRYLARGAGGVSSIADGAGGGGAGGGIVLRARGPLGCLSAEASGGNGGGTGSNEGAGAAGGGGVVSLQGASVSCVRLALAGFAGSSGGSVGQPTNATVGSVSSTSSSFPDLAAPTFAAGSCGVTTTTARAVTIQAPTGTSVVLFDGSAVLCSGTTASGSFTCTPTLALGSHTLVARARSGALYSPPSATCSITYALAAPTFTSVPATVVASNSATIAFTGAVAGTVYDCSLDGAAFAVCTSPRSLTGLANGGHAFSVRVRDTASGITSPSATTTWSVDTVAPPTPTFTTVPPALTNATTASLAFTDTEAGVTFECRLDSAPFAPCTSPRSLTGLAPGGHTFRVRALDTVGNTSAEAVATWNIDTSAPPPPTITSSPPAFTNATSGQVAFTATGTPTFQCRVDGGAYGPCASPVTVSNLAQGTHTFDVYAVSGAGNSSAPARASWTVDLTPPGATTLSGSPPATTSQTGATFTFSNADPTATFRCKVDMGAFASCASPTALAMLADGAHSFAVFAVDPAGNEGPTATATWTVDTSAPPRPTFSSVPPPVTNATSATWAFASTEADVTFECSLDSGAFATCTSPTTRTGLAAGDHTFDVRAVDAAGNRSESTSNGFTVDDTAPTTTITSGPPARTFATTVTYEFESNEPGATFECRIDADPFASCATPSALSGYSRGPHTFDVRAKDLAGNVDATPARGTFVFGCTANAECGETAPACVLATYTCGPCIDDSACGGTTPACDATTGRCVACTRDTHCTAPRGRCQIATATCVACVSNADCSDPTPACALGPGVCGTSCATDADCGAGRFCTTAAVGNGVCAPKVVNGERVPASEGGACTTAVAARVCTSGACDDRRDVCGVANGGSCGPPANSSVCLSLSCSPTDTRCGLSNGDACTTVPECRSAICAADGLCGSPNGSPCGANSECRGLCVSTGTSTACGLPNGYACSSAFECANQLCDTDGRCGLSDGATCQRNEICRSGACRAGTCVSPCTAALDCATGTYCDAASSTCRPRHPTGSVCTADGECYDGACTAGVCASPCTMDSSCRESSFCDGTKCVPDRAPGATCARAAECVANACATDGRCGLPDRSPCTSPAQCRSRTCEDGRACGTTCVSDADCVFGTFCDDTRKSCVATLGGGRSCTRASQCASSVCAMDGACGERAGSPCTHDGACRSGSCLANRTCSVDAPLDAGADATSPDDSGADATLPPTDSGTDGAVVRDAAATDSGAGEPTFDASADATDDASGPPPDSGLVGGGACGCREVPRPPSFGSAFGVLFVVAVARLRRWTRRPLSGRTGRGAKRWGPPS